MARSVTHDNPNLPISRCCRTRRSLRCLVGVATIRVMCNQDCPSDIVESIDVLVAARDKPHTVLDSDGIPMDILHLVVVMTPYHHRDERKRGLLLFAQNPVCGVLHCDDTWNSDAIESPRGMWKRRTAWRLKGEIRYESNDKTYVLLFVDDHIYMAKVCCVLLPKVSFVFSFSRAWR